MPRAPTLTTDLRELSDLGRLRDDALLDVLADEPELAEWLALSDTAWGSWRPRPDNPALFDEQSGYCNNRDTVAFLCAGNASGKTSASAHKLANFVLHQQRPPRRDTPFWVIAKTYEQVCSVCWGEKLIGEGHIPNCEIDWSRISWIDRKRGWPSVVPLKPWPGRKGNWCLHFKSYEQGRESMQAASIGGFWFSEQFPGDLFVEVLRGCRQYLFPGGQFCEFTPIDPDMCMWVERLIDETPPGWRFYRCNTECNTSLARDWLENFKAAIPDEMLETRLRGALATFEGVIYQAFNPAVHVVGSDRIDPFLPGLQHVRGVDWGASEEHPFACVWACRDGIGDWWVYDEYWNPSQSAVMDDHVEEILDRSDGWGWPDLDVKDAHYGATYADPSRPGDINLFNLRGIPTSPALNAVFQGINTVRSLLKVSPYTGKPKLYVHHRCRHLIDELRKYRWKKGRKPASGALNPAAGTPVPLKRDDDLCDALRYALHSATVGRGAGPSSTDARRKAEQRRSIQARGLGRRRIFG